MTWYKNNSDLKIRENMQIFLNSIIMFLTPSIFSKLWLYKIYNGYHLFEGFTMN